jgi:glyoxylase-like metal-dependent hydrolase (beta-lactamase superfamily II)
MHIDLGGVTVDVLRDGTFRLDGGAMFGVVPRALWERRKPADERNRVRLGLNCLLVRGAGPVTLVDTGIGAAWDDKRRDIFGIDRTPGIEAELARCGVAAAEVELVVNTHLHFDHAGGNTVEQEGGAFRPAYPNARYAVQRGNLEDEARSPHELRRASYLPHTFEPIAEQGCWELLEGDAELASGLEVALTRGHALFHQSVIVRGRAETLFYPGDLIPTAAHLDPPWIMAYDHEPLRTLENKKRWLPRAADEGWICVLEHEAEEPVGRVVRDGKRYRWEPL